MSGLRFAVVLLAIAAALAPCVRAHLLHPGGPVPVRQHMLAGGGRGAN